ncbi:uncharacterized protein ACLA_059730 [Aspergillus clavatus NRRL 1]|uniref:ABC transporter domain-containing protein n=1 Tax=Aspergillus clavatus (strain ATCC 1007 / CBS 513.65 / DSM 816 / NCTC 3887 / NRRL 1 / QM 1276 / 107) TaxID=344612 RepID=A1C4G6_ASPCL|nr:uncharacterized protein ACLA_059730 [Aspergillus clavatus NRRL 1]EAW15306.1 hypothetical protein ACLA_059730 [Aspergillus clavatus NRRL 1]
MNIIKQFLYHEGSVRNLKSGGRPRNRRVVTDREEVRLSTRQWRRPVPSPLGRMSLSWMTSSAVSAPPRRNMLYSDALDQTVSSHRESLSNGQQKLFCLERALLRDQRVVVLDEISSNLGHETDTVIQKVLQTEFADKTMIIIAHRPRTIMHCDKVAMMADGNPSWPEEGVYAQ